MQPCKTSSSRVDPLHFATAVPDIDQRFFDIAIYLLNAAFPEKPIYLYCLSSWSHGVREHSLVRLQSLLPLGRHEGSNRCNLDPYRLKDKKHVRFGLTHDGCSLLLVVGSQLTLHLT